MEMEQTGELVCPATLPKLTSDQKHGLNLAKKYCQDITSKHQQSKQNDVQLQQMASLQDAANQQRALLLMSRIYIGSINFELGEETIRVAFAPFGTIKSINMSWDSATMKHKGYAFVEYETAEAAQMSLEQMTGVIVGGRNIKVGRPNNVPQAAPIIASIQESASKLPRIYVASIHTDLTAKDVKSVFEAFGKVKKVELAPDTMPGKHRGWGFIDYENTKSAADAIASMNLFDLGGQFLRVGRALTPPLPLFPPNAAPVLPTLLTSAALGYTSPVIANKTIDPNLCIIDDGDSKKGVVPPVATVTKTPVAKVTPQVQGGDTANGGSDLSSLADIQAKLKASNEEKEAVAGEMLTSLQQEEEVSISGSNARLMIMQKLSRKSESTVVVLRNMVTLEDIDDDLEEEVTSECSRYGNVVKVLIYQERQGMEEDAEIIVKIFVAFSKPAEADNTIKSLNGRWFGGRVISAESYDQAKYDAGDLSH